MQLEIESIENEITRRKNFMISEIQKFHDDFKLKLIKYKDDFKK
jgi:hypothetical protein